MTAKEPQRIAKPQNVEGTPVCWIRIELVHHKSLRKREDYGAITHLGFRCRISDDEEGTGISLEPLPQTRKWRKETRSHSNATLERVVTTATLEWRKRREEK
jgi:hypothetical protein